MTESHSATEDLQSRILQLHVKVRYTAFVKKFMEHYKQSEKENMQETKGLRAKLNAEP